VLVFRWRHAADPAAGPDPAHAARQPLPRAVPYRPYSKTPLRATAPGRRMTARTPRAAATRLAQGGDPSGAGSIRQAHRQTG